VRADSSFEAEFRRVFESRYPSLFRYLDRLSGDPELAADVAQVTFIRLYQRGTMPEDIPGWLASVANNLVRDEHRRSARRLRLLARETAESAGDDELELPDAELVVEERRRAVRAALDTMQERERQLLLLRYEGYSYRELATALGLTESSVGTLLARAKAAFRSAFEERYGASARS
jgi:RNA polymerase sigma factor (sigma-70 family)